MHCICALAEENARKISAYDIPGVETKPFTSREFLERHVTLGVGSPDSREEENAYVRLGRDLALDVVICSTHAWVGFEQNVVLVFSRQK